MGETGFGFWFGAVAMTIGIAMILASTHSDALALGGAALVVVGSLCTAISFDDRTDT